MLTYSSIGSIILFYGGRVSVAVGDRTVPENAPTGKLI